MALISSGGLGTATSALVGFHYLFSKSDKSNIEGIIATDIELYKKMYYKQFKKEKIKNVMVSIGVKGIVCALGALIVAGSVSSAISDGEPFPLP